MEEHRNKVSKLHAIQSQNIGEFTSNISKNTSKLTSRTDQNEPLMGAMGGGLPSASSSARVGEYTWERYAGRGDGGRVVLNSDRRANPPKGLLARL